MKREGAKLNISVPEGAAYIINTLEKRGFEAYIVGGSVRDALLQRTPSDWDIATSAPPSEVKNIFRHTCDTGLKHGTVTVLYAKKAYEVTTYRVDGAYRDSRHPESVEFTESLLLDLERRDFTVNAMAYHPVRGLVDPFRGRDDLFDRVIRAVGDPDARFTEDALRVLRAVRFAGELCFTIEENTALAVRRHAESLSLISKERIAAELSKLVCSAHIEKTEDIFTLGLAPFVAPFFEDLDTGILSKIRESSLFPAEKLFPDTETGRFSAFCLDSETDLRYRYVRFAFLLLSLPREKAGMLLKGLKADNITLKNTLFLSESALKPLPAERAKLKGEMSLTEKELFRDLLMFKKCIGNTGLYEASCPGEDIEHLIDIYLDILENGEPIYLTDLEIGGEDLIKLGVPKGPEVGKELRRLQKSVLEDPSANERKILLQKARKHLSEAEPMI